MNLLQTLFRIVINWTCKLCVKICKKVLSEILEKLSESIANKVIRKLNQNQQNIKKLQQHKKPTNTINNRYHH